MHAVVHSQPHAVPKKQLNKKLYVTVLVCLVVVASFGLFVFDRIQNSTTTADKSDNKDANFGALIERAKKQQSSNDANAELQLVEDILATDKYDTDINLLYIVTAYYLDQGNSVQTRLYFTKLQEVYRGNKVFSADLGQTKSMVQLESDVLFLEAQAAKIIESTKNGLVSQ